MINNSTITANGRGAQDKTFNTIMSAVQLMMSGFQNPGYMTDMPGTETGSMDDDVYVDKLKAAGENEEKMTDSLFRFLADCFAEFFTVEQIRKMADTFTSVRHRESRQTYRKPDVIFTGTAICSSITPTFQLQKSELYLIGYVLMHYSRVTRIQMAEILKGMFPGVFSGTGIMSMKTKLSQNNFTNTGKLATLQFHTRLNPVARIEAFTPEGIEQFLLGY